MHRDALVGAVVLFLILSISMDLLGNKDRIVVSPYQPISYSGIPFDSHGATTLVTPGLPGIAITFNGWAVDEWYSIMSLLSNYSAKVTFFVGNIDNLTSSEFGKLRTMKNAGHEVAISGLRYVNAVEFVRNNSLQAYIDEEIAPAIELMTENELPPKSFAYPFGSRNSTIDAELLKYFIRLRSTAHTSNTTRIVDLDSVYYKWQNEVLIRGVGIDSEYGNTVDEIIQGLERAHQSDEVIILYGHTPTYDSPDYGTPVEKLASILEAAQTMNLVFYRVSDLVLPGTGTSTTPIDNRSTGITSSTGGLNDIAVSVLMACAGIGLLWVVVSVIFRDKEGWQSHSA